MDLKIKKRKIEFIVLVIVMLQIFLLINLTTANSYMIHQAGNLIKNSIIEQKQKNKIKNLVNSGINLLIGFLSIKQIGIVSAVDELESLGCCTNTCQDIFSEEDKQNCDEFSTNKCEDTSCKLGCCIDECASNSPKKFCEADGGEWRENTVCEIYNECEYGCCISTTDKSYTTRLMCEKDFYPSISERACRFFTHEEGACINQGVCKFTTERYCEETSHGNFHRGKLCSHPDINATFGIECKPHDYIGCVEGKDEIYWFDSCKNRENIYASNAEDSWNEGWVQSKTESCNPDDSNIDSTDCGNCGYNFESVCSETGIGETHVEDGNFICKSLNCDDEDKKNGESWCVYDGFVGTSKDAVGSEHWKRGCVNGEVITDHSTYREKICAEKDLEDISTAQLRYNEGWKCFNIVLNSYEWDEDEEEIVKSDGYAKNIAECNAIPDCRVQETHIGDSFWFDVCVPKYPKGFDINSGRDDVCEIASQTCTVAEQEKGGFLWWGKKWKCKDEHNCECTDKKFIEEMNDFCISLGDCGGYINIANTYSKNYRVSKKGNQGSLSSRYALGILGSGVLPAYFMSADLGSYKGEFLGEIYSTELGLFETLGMKEYAAVGAAIGGLITGGNPLGILIGTIIGTVIETIMRWFGLGKKRTVEVEFTCMSWQPPPGGKDCELCNGVFWKKCTEYRCQSLGTACGLIDENTDNPICIDKYSTDVEPPIIHFEGNYGYTEGTNGIQITDCIQELSPINFTLKTKDKENNDEYAQCQYTFAPTPPDYENMNGEYFKEGTRYSTFIHTFEETLPSMWNEYVSDISGTLGERTGEFNIYVRCQDPKGNYNPNEYVVKMCIKEGVDNEIALIKEYNPETESFLPYNITNSILIIKLDEPADCRLSYGTDKAYDDMESFTSCETYDPSVIKSRWTCSTKLTNLTESVNNIYIKCKDQPWINDDWYKTEGGEKTEGDRNVNTESFLYKLYSTENDLSITSISPQGEIVGGGNIFQIDLEVETSGGMANGISTCNFDFINHVFSGDLFMQKDSYHEYSFTNLPSGDYNISLHCWDDVGNEDYGNAIFNLNVDSSLPIVVRVYKKGGNLKLITNEDAKCYYDFNRCNFNLENGTSMTTAFSTEHSAKWNSGQTYYVICRDYWNNKDCKKIIPSS